MSFVKAVRNLRYAACCVLTKAPLRGLPPEEALRLALKAPEIQLETLTAPSPVELVQRLQETEDALLEVAGWKPTGRPDHYLDTLGDERWSPGTTWPRSTALDFARERVTRGTK